MSHLKEKLLFLFGIKTENSNERFDEKVVAVLLCTQLDEIQTQRNENKKC